MMLLKLAFRNALRYKRRSLAVGLGIFISIFSLQFLDGIFEGFKKSFMETLLDREGVVLVSPEGGIDPFEQSLRSVSGYREIVSFISQKRKDASIEPSVEFPATVTKDSFNLDLFVSGVEKDAGIINTFKPRLTSGREIKGVGEGMIGEEAAGFLHITEGDTLIILAQDRYGGIGVKEVHIVGIHKGRNKIENGKMLFIDMKTAQGILSWGSDEVTKLKVNFKDYDSAGKVASEIGKKFPHTKVEPYKKRIKNVDTIMRITDIKMRIFVAIILIASAGIIVNTVLTSVFERKKEIGTLRAIGAGRFEMVNMIIGEVMLISITSIFVGSILAGILVNWLSVKGLYFGAASGVIKYIEETIYPAIILSKWIGNVIFILFWTLLAAAYPVIIAVKMKPCDALKR